LSPFYKGRCALWYMAMQVRMRRSADVRSYCLLLNPFTDHVDLDDFCSRHGTASRCSETRTSGDRLGSWRRSLANIWRQSLTTLRWISPARNFAMAPRWTPW
jgi:hypothetical protein